MSNTNIFSSEKLPLNPSDMGILREIFNHGSNYQKDLAIKCKSTISCISKALNRLEEYGLVYCIPHPTKFYNIIPERKKEVGKLLSGYHFGKNSPILVDAHRFVFQCNVNSLSEKMEGFMKKDDKWLLYEPKNWYAYKQKSIDGSILIHKTKKRVIMRFYFRTFATSPEIAEMINIEKFIEKKRALEDKYFGLKIGEHEVMAKCPYSEVALLQDPLSVKALLLGLKHKAIEDSHRIGGEWEEKGINAVEKISKLIKQRVKDLSDI
jgi:hypothetical protein